MVPENIRGEWRLVASGSINAEIAFINDEEPDPNGVSDWLNGFDHALVAASKPTSGLTLSIAADGTFSEIVSGNPQVYWFDVEGVLESEVIPFSGVVVHNDQASYLRPTSIATWATPVEGRYGLAVLRYDDGDTEISDSVRLVENQLIRTVNVVTDELYLDRIAIVYERIS